MAKRYVPLIPAYTSPVSAASAARAEVNTGVLQNVNQRALAPKRSLVSVACQECRVKKAKCNAGRPSCGRCTTRQLECKYEVEECDSSRYSALKRRNDSLVDENEQLRELFDFLRKRPEREAYEIFTRIRTAEDPIAVINFVKQGELLLMDPSANAHRLDSRLLKLDALALEEARIKVRAKPWTNVADDGLVSVLVTSFFTWDNPFFCPFIDRDAFVEEMNSQDPRSTKHCTPLLVNAMCALRTFTCNRAKVFGLISGKELGVQFFAEAKKLLNQEYGRFSLPTVQALCLMYVHCGLLGMDREGTMYRFRAYEMLKRLDLEKAFSRLRDDDPEDVREKRIISETLWGLFCFGSISGYVYLQQCIMRPPTVPRIFARDSIQLEDSMMNVDMFGKPFIAATSPPPPFVVGTLSASCDMSELLYEIMSHNSDETIELGSEADLKKRQELYSRVRELIGSLPRRLRADKNFTPETCFLKVYSNELAISVLRPLHHDVVFQEGDVTVKDLCLAHSRMDIETMEHYVREFRFADFSCMAVCGFYNPSLTLASMLHDPRSHDLFTRACFRLRQTVNNYPMSSLILKGLQALAWSLKQTIPPGALHCMEGLGSNKEELKDVPIGFAIPQHDEVRRLLADDQDTEEMAGQLGTLIAKWSAMTVE